MTPYFSKFPKMTYDMSGTGMKYVMVTDLIHRVKFKEVVKKNAYVYYPYTVNEEETPEIIAAKLYGSAQYHWIILFANDIYYLWEDWPLSYHQFQAYITKKYGTVDASMTLIHHYELNGFWIDQATYNENISNGAKIIYAYDYELDRNEVKRDIHLIDTKYVKLIEDELDKLLVK